MPIREAQNEDIPRLVELWRAMMDEHCKMEPRIRLSGMTEVSYQSYLMLHLRSPKGLVLGAGEEGGPLRGFCCAYVCQNLPMFEPPEFGYLSDLYVEPECRGRGWGRAMLDRTRDFFRAQGMRCAQLQVYTANASGRQFWAAQGFEPFFERLWLDLDGKEAPDDGTQ